MIRRENKLFTFTLIPTNNDTAHTIALYSTVKFDGVYTISFISRYMC
jgi:hypothetical protein